MTSPVAPRAMAASTASSTSVSSLSGRDRSIGTPAAAERRDAVLAERIAVADPQVDADAERLRVAGAAVGRDDEVRPRVPARPGGIELGARRRVAVGEDQGDHPPMLRGAQGVGRGRPCRRPTVRPDARLRRVSDAPVHPSVQRVLDAAARKGVTLEVVTFDESTHTAAEAAAAVGAELGQIVKSLVFVVPGDGRAGAGPVPRRRPQPGRPGAARGGHQRPRHPSRDGARGPRPDRVRHRRGPADRPARAGPGDHGPGPRPLPGRVGGGRPVDGGLRGPAGDAPDPGQRDGRADRRGAARPRDRSTTAAAGVLGARVPGVTAEPRNATITYPGGLRARWRWGGSGSAADVFALSEVGGSLVDLGPTVSSDPDALCRAELRVEGPRGAWTVRFASLISDEPRALHWDTAGLLVVAYGFHTYGLETRDRRAPAGTTARRRRSWRCSARPGSSTSSSPSELETFAIEADGTVAWRVAHSDVVTAAELVGGRLVLTASTARSAPSIPRRAAARADAVAPAVDGAVWTTRGQPPISVRFGG